MSWQRWRRSGGLWGARGARALPRAPGPPGPTPRPPPQLSKRAASYRKAFGELAERDALLGCFSCAWQREVPYHGRLYISSRHVCFHASLLLKDIKVGWGRAGASGSGGGTGSSRGHGDAAWSPPAQVVVPVASISALKKTNTALLVPNALSIRTAEGAKVRAGPGPGPVLGAAQPGAVGGPCSQRAGGRDRGSGSGTSPLPAPRQFLFVSLHRREATYQLLRSVCKHLQVRTGAGRRRLRPPIAGPWGWLAPPGSLLHLPLSRTTSGALWPL